MIAALVLSGIASWFYPNKIYIGMRVCAMPQQSMIGRRVSIFNPFNHKRSVCTIVGLGPFVDGRIIDVSPLVKFDLRMHDLNAVQVRPIPR